MHTLKVKEQDLIVLLNITDWNCGILFKYIEFVDCESADTRVLEKIILSAKRHKRNITGIYYHMSQENDAGKLVKYYQVLYALLMLCTDRNDDAINFVIENKIRVPAEMAVELSKSCDAEECELITQPCAKKYFPKMYDVRQKNALTYRF
jgi:hypothetical protein